MLSDIASSGSKISEGGKMNFKKIMQSKNIIKRETVKQILNKYFTDGGCLNILFVFGQLKFLPNCLKDSRNIYCSIELIILNSILFFVKW